MRFDPNPTWNQFKLTFFAVWPVCSLASMIGLGASPTFLDFVVNMKSSDHPAGLQPDISLAGDPAGEAGVSRLPTLRLEGGRVVACEVGGEVIEGTGCPCDPRVNAGYSAVLQLDGVPAQVAALCDER
jgi:hypothetical protein